MLRSQETNDSEGDKRQYEFFNEKQKSMASLASC